MEQLADLGDAQLVVLVAQSNDRALAELYRRHARALFGLARRVVSDPSEAEDVTQEAFLHLWSRPDRFDAGRGSLRTYLLNHVHGRAVDVVRSRAARRRREERDARAAIPSGDDLDREVWDLTVADQISRAVSMLPAGERAVIELAYFEGLTYREVAHRLSQPDGTVKSRIRSGLRRMRAGLVADGALDR